MKFTETPIAGAFLIEIEPIRDERGFFARTVCRDEFTHHGLNTDFVQQSISYNNRRGILRGMHCQVGHHKEDKLVRTTHGAIFDVIVDLRPDSPTYRHWHAEELSEENHRALYIPRGLAHGFQTLVDETEVLYQMTIPYRPDAARGFRWDDPDLEIAWPMPTEAILSPKDLCWGNMEDLEAT